MCAPECCAALRIPRNAEMAERYKCLSRANLNLAYIHANSTTHEFLFGAFAEIIDNSRDASASTLYIYSEPTSEFQGGQLLCFLDDGCGMTQREACDLIYFGRSSKRFTSSKFIGRYGNGLKSGSMRIGKDFILFTMKGDCMTCLLFSQTFCETEGLDELIVPILCWSQSTKKPSTESSDLVDMQMSIMNRYSPFKTERDLLKQFDYLYSGHGTLIIVYNLKLMSNGEPELDFFTDISNIINAGMKHRDVYSELWSLKSYISVLYVDPRMKVFVQATRVHNKQLIYSLYRPRMYPYKMPSLRTSVLREIKNAEVAVKNAKLAVADIEQKMAALRKRADHSNEKELDVLNVILINNKKNLDEKCQILKEKKREEKQSKHVYIKYGLNIENRSQDGMFIYHNSRLIRMHEKVGRQLNKELSTGAGVLGLVNLPPGALIPSHNKQNFIKSREYINLLKHMGYFLDQFLKDSGISEKETVYFWSEFGYISGLKDWFEVPSDTVHFVRRRAIEIPKIIQCDLCLNWRVLPFSESSFDQPDSWMCADHPDPAKIRCTEPEQLPTIPVGTLPRKPLQFTDKEKHLRDSIERYKNKRLWSQKCNLTEPHLAVTALLNRSSLQRKEEKSRIQFFSKSGASSKNYKESNQNRVITRKQTRDRNSLKDNYNQITKVPHASSRTKLPLSKTNVRICTAKVGKTVVEPLCPASRTDKGKNFTLGASAQPASSVSENNVANCIAEAVRTLEVPSFSRKEMEEKLKLTLGTSAPPATSFSENVDNCIAEVPSFSRKEMEEKLKLTLGEVISYFVPDCQLPILETIYEGDQTQLRSLVDDYFKEYEENVLAIYLNAGNDHISAKTELNVIMREACEEQIKTVEEKISALSKKATRILKKLNINMPEEIGLDTEKLLLQEQSEICETKAVTKEFFLSGFHKI
ncbi:MORC family CW-type zinc finger protein 1-like isoform X2 [Xenopus laevis]|uniref:MORC family CW-type zinc finger protein 1-like isoform X2 n=1 Tax=Xenopus laevis TaxID=8355 RepID=A0A8J1MDN5_XENLA|nr:MORC family CW-type zinc finger protein 1-like isoform X2 [Xenopus laevis]